MLLFADLDPNGLAIARSLGLGVCDVSLSTLDQCHPTPGLPFTLITAVHVLEHLEDPSAFFSDILPVVNLNSLIYVEIPSRFFLPLSDPSHLTTFSKDSLVNLASKFGFELLQTNTISSPREVINYGHELSSPFEARYFVFKYSGISELAYSFACSSISSVHIFLLRSLFADLFLSCVAFLNYFLSSIFQLSHSLKFLIRSCFTFFSAFLQFFFRLIFLLFK